MKNKKALVVCKYPKNSKDSLVCKMIEKEGFEFKYHWKNSLKADDLKNIALVISIGGDGTALSSSHFLLDKPLLAVNSAPGKSEGVLTTLNYHDLYRKLDEIKEGKFETELLERIEVYINNKLQNPLALNEVFIANEKAFLVSKYKLRIVKNGMIKEEEQRSSGIIFSTGAGSTAWFSSAGGEQFSAQEKYIKMIVREPYFGKLGKFSIVNETIDEKEEIEVIAETKMVLAIDSIREFKLKIGDKIRVKISKWPLRRIK